MNITRILLFSIISLIFICAICLTVLILLKLLTKNKKTQYPIPVPENYAVVPYGSTKIPTLQEQQEPFRCENNSLNEQHKTGNVEKQPWATSCDTAMSSDEGEDKFYKKYKPIEIFGASFDLDNSGRYGILGANYTSYNNNPNPINLDYPLYDGKLTTVMANDK